MFDTSDGLSLGFKVGSRMKQTTGVTSKGALRAKKGGRLHRCRTLDLCIGKPISSNASRLAVCSSEVSPCSTLPPGNATSPGCEESTQYLAYNTLARYRDLSLTFTLRSIARVLRTTLSSPVLPPNRATITPARRS